jgi:hypothetical protein
MRNKRSGTRRRTGRSLFPRTLNRASGLPQENANRERETRGARDDGGAILVLALLFLLVVGGLIGSLSTWATNDLNNTKSFATSRTLQYAVSSAMETGIQSIRYTPLLSSQLPSTLTPPTTTSTSPSFCWGSSSPSQVTVNNLAVAVWCTTIYTPTSADTRVVTLSACPATTSAGQCVASPILQAVVTFGDYPPGYSAPTTVQCQVYCGASMTINSWVWSGGSITPSPPTTTTTTTVPPTTTTTTTTTTTVPPTTTTTTTVPRSNGVTVTPSSANSNTYSGDDQLNFTNTSPMTALSITIKVAQTTGTTLAGQWADRFPGNLTMSEGTSGGYFIYTYVQTGSATPVQNSDDVVAQWGGSALARVTSGDLWSVTSTSGGITTTLTGTF